MATKRKKSGQPDVVDLAHTLRRFLNGETNKTEAIAEIDEVFGEEFPLEPELAKE